ncbi:MAG: hypothetical protein HY247_04110 [archaeon]|nr:MAG: hypothetical protein HY247_04110 [archaeon]
MRALTRLADSEVSKAVETSLGRLGFKYYTNRGQRITEFETSFPVKFLVTIENLNRSQFGFPLRSSFRIESALEVKPLVGSGEDMRTVRTSARALVIEIRRELPQPWKGMGFRSKSQEVAWMNLGEL